MRTTFGRVVLVVLVGCSLCGCRSPSNLFSWSRKKPSNSALAEAPAFNPALPSAGQSPGAAPTNVPGSNLAAGGATSPGGSLAATGAAGAQQGAYQQAVYPTTPYEPARIGQTAGGGTPTSWSTSAASWNNSASNPGPAVGYAQNNQPAGGYGYGPGSAAPGYATSSSPAGAPADATAVATQPQAGFYNPAYNGSGAPPAYNNGHSTPAGSPYAAAGPSGAYGAPASITAAAQPPPDAGPQYRTADTRSTMPAASYSAAAQTIAPAAADAQTNSMVGDRYSNMSGGNTMSNPYVNSTPAASAPVTGQQMPVSQPQMSMPPAQSPGPAAGSAYGSPVGDRYSQPASDYRPGATSYQPGNTGYQAPSVSPPPGSPGYAPPTPTGNPPGNTGYTPPNVYAPGASTIPAASGQPPRPDPGYRPGGTSSYSPQGTNKRTATASASSQPESRPHSSEVTPASYNAPISGSPPARSPSSSPMLLAAPDVAASADSGMGGSSDGAMPAYGASDAGASEPGLFPGHAW